MRLLVWVLFFLSGACGLVYEVVWTRMMTHVFGSTALAVGTVLAAFMSGLAAGAWLLGKAADRSRNPLRLYALLEVGVGLAALAAHLLLARIEPVYVAAYDLLGRSDAALGVARFVLAFLLVLGPTMLMGATLPTLTRFFVRRLSAMGKGLSALYAVNTAGAVGGTLLAGFHLIRAHGLDATVYAAVVTNLAIGGIAWAASRGLEEAPEQAEPEPPRPRRKRRKVRAAAELLDPRVYRMLLLGLGVSGFTSFAYEIYWMRSLVFLLGNSTYAVTTMLTAFLTGIALGGYLARFLVDRVRDRVVLFGWLQLLIAVSAVAALPALFAFADPGAIHDHMVAIVGRIPRLFASRFGVSLLVMLVPATFIGMTFPLVGRAGVDDLRETGSRIGRIYAVNTLGNVAGALLPGLLLLRWFGIQRGILIMAGLNALVGLALLVLRMGRVRRLRWAVPVAVAAALLVVGRVPLEFQFPSEAQEEWHRVLFYREGPSATTMVLLDPDTREKSMSVDGVDIGGNSFTDYKQQLLAHLPKLLLDDVSTELSIGLGSGILAGESARHRRVREITCVEIEPSVVTGARLFAAENHDVLRSGRVSVVVDDVASYLRVHSGPYQVISADEKTSQEYASNGFSYSAEYYTMLRDRLADGGIVAQWVPSSLPPSQYAMVLRTFSGTFPHVLLWYFPPAFQKGTYNTILVGSNEPVDLDAAAMGRRLAAAPDAFEGIARYGLTSAEAVLAQLVADGDAIREAVRDAPRNTLNHPRYEFYSPRDYAVPMIRRVAANVEVLAALRRASAPSLQAAMMAGAPDPARLEEALAAEREFEEGHRQRLAGAPDRAVLRRFDSAVAAAPWSDSIRARVFLQYWEITEKYSARQDYRNAAGLMQQALSVYAESPLAHVYHSMVLSRAGDVRRAVEAARAAVGMDPGLVAARRMLAMHLLAAGRRQEAAEQLRALLGIEPEDADARRLLAGL